MCHRNLVPSISAKLTNENFSNYLAAVKTTVFAPLCPADFTDMFKLTAAH